MGELSEFSPIIDVVERQEEEEMTKAELIEAVAQTKAIKNKVSKKAIQMIIDSTFDEIKKSIKKEDRFSFPGFGTFNKKKRGL